ncbi:hypothetical protein [Oricola sp.]|uniref:hypothetical protein n=1 Tax=Oricola sp. TaxID=1979950 RepID=UPI003BA88392
MSYTLRDFGSYTVGGRIARVTEGHPQQIAVTREVSYDYDPRGDFVVEHAYVQYFIPGHRNKAPAVVLVHGGGMSGSVWERTPDGRRGWLHMLLDRGYEVHVIDNVERGRAGFAPGLWSGAPITRSLQEAWRLFRIGSDAGFATRSAFAGQRFPHETLEQLARTFVPRWLSTTGLQAAALAALLHRLGGAVLVCHSQGAEVAFAAIAEGGPVRALLAIEPSAGPQKIADLQAIPTALVAGDFLNIDPMWAARLTAWRALCADLAATGGHADFLPSGGALKAGHSHLPMHDRGHDMVLAAGLEALSHRL